MAKIDKSKYSKEEYRRLKEQRKIDKARERIAKQSAIERSKPQPNPTLIKIQEHAQELVEENVSGMRKAFIIGNGMSRKGIPLEPLRAFGKMYGCNAIYRTFDPDYLIAVDTRMVFEITKTGWHLTRPLWTNPNRSYRNITHLNLFDPSKGWSSGPTALWLASQHKHKIIYILGFDYKGLDDGRFVNNIFSSTPNYKKSGDRATFYGNWLKQTVITVKENPNIQYVRVIDKEGFIPPDLVNIDNIKHITVEDFKNRHGLM